MDDPMLERLYEAHAALLVAGCTKLADGTYLDKDLEVSHLLTVVERSILRREAENAVFAAMAARRGDAGSNP